MFKLSANGIEKIFRASRSDANALNWIVNKLKFRGLKEAKRFIKMIVFEGDVESDDEDHEDNIQDLDTDLLRVA